MRLRTTAILRGLGAERTADIAEQCWEAGMDLVEVPVQGEAGWASFEGVAARAGGRAFGAGTVLTPEDVRRAVDTGAAVIISPGLDREVVEATLEAGALPLPGVLTPTDVTAAARLGLGICKLFPASAVGPGFVSALHGPFPSVELIAVGGVDRHNAAEYVRSGVAGVALGSSIESLLAVGDAAAWVAGLHALLDERPPRQAA